MSHPNQQQLSLFDVALPTEPVHPAGSLMPAPVQAPLQAPVQAPAAPPVSAPAVVDASSAGVAHQSPWWHPQANRQSVVDGRVVAWVLKRGQRRTIGFSVTAQGLSVSAPRWVTVGAVEAALQERAHWVTEKLRTAGQQHAALQAARVDWRDGVELAWLGGSLRVQLAQHAAPSGRRTGKPLVEREGNGLWVSLPAGAQASQLRDAVQAWMMRAAQAHFAQRLDHFAGRLGVVWRSLRLSSAHTRWGSAKADGSIRLHWRLMQFSEEVVDYVVAHELAHLRHMDHSERFWQTVASVVPDYAALRAQLKGERLPPW